MIDSGATGNFMSSAFTKANGIATRKKEDRYNLIAVNGLSLPSVVNELVLLLLVI